MTSALSLEKDLSSVEAAETDKSSDSVIPVVSKNDPSSAEALKTDKSSDSVIPVVSKNDPSSAEALKTDNSSDSVIPVAPKNFVGKDAYERVNFLYQAAMQILSIQPCNVELVRYYIKCLCDIKEKKVLRLSREMKHTICYGCNMLLVGGITASVKGVKNGQNVMTCLSCKTKKRKNSEHSDVKRKRRKKKEKVLETV